MTMSIQTKLNCALTARSSLAGLVLSLLLAGFSGASFAAPDVWVAFGDSITKGWPYYPYELRGSRGGAYPGRLERIVRDNRPESEVHIHNWGIGGETTYQSIGRFSSVLQSSRPSHALILIGTNDLWSGVSPYSTAANVGAMISAAQNSGVVPIVSNLTPSTYPGHGGSRIASLYNPQLEQVIESKNAILVDAYGALIDNWHANTSDGLHMNQAGYQRLAETFCNAMVICLPPVVAGTLPFLELLLGDDDVEAIVLPEENNNSSDGDNDGDDGGGGETADGESGSALPADGGGTGDGDTSQ